MAIKEINWNKADIDTSKPGSVIIDDKNFAESIKNNPDEIFDLIRQKMMPIDSRNVKIDPLGRVIFNDDKFRDEIERAVTRMDAADAMVNIGCGLGC